jgi:hypothetical protein
MSDQESRRAYASGLNPEGLEPNKHGPGPWRWLVTWGTLLSHGFHKEIVEAFDAQDALSQARRRRPDLPPPSSAFLTSSAQETQVSDSEEI